MNNLKDEDYQVKIVVPTLVEVGGVMQRISEQEYVLFGDSIKDDLRTTLEALNAYYEWLDEEGMHECLMEFINKRWEEKWGGMFSWGSVNE